MTKHAATAMLLRASRLIRAESLAVAKEHSINGLGKLWPTPAGPTARNRFRELQKIAHDLTTMSTKLNGGPSSRKAST